MNPDAIQQLEDWRAAAAPDFNRMWMLTSPMLAGSQHDCMLLQTHKDDDPDNVIEIHGESDDVDKAVTTALLAWEASFV